MGKASREKRVRRLYLDDVGRTYIHEEAPSRVWQPMHRTGTMRFSGHVKETWENEWYDATAERFDAGFPVGGGPYVVIGISHYGQSARHDWRDMQRIKNDLSGADWEGLELYPAESRLIDVSNRFYLWCVPAGVIRWGLPPQERRVYTMAESQAPQRPFPEELCPAQPRSAL